MKRVGNLYQHICSMENLILADKKARKGKGGQYGVKHFDKDPQGNLQALQQMLLNKTYKTSAYTKFIIHEPKEREIYRLPYFPDRLVHHAAMNILEKYFTAMFTADTYSCIKGKGIHAATYALRRSLQDVAGTQYCLKLDIKKFYPSVDHVVLKTMLQRKFKDRDLLTLFFGIIDSAEGIPIGNLLSQYFANFYLTPFDHWLKEKKKVKYYFRYADDMVILSDNKPYLHQLLSDIRTYLDVNLKLTIKHNYQVFPVAKRGIDFVGYPTWHTHSLLRKGIKKNLARTIKYSKNPASLASYTGWAKHCNSRHLLKKLLNDPIQ